MRMPALLALLLALAACTNWPERGYGGMAEWRAPVLAEDAEPTSAAQNLRLRMGCAVNRLDTLHQQAGQRGVLTGRFMLAQDEAALVQREFAAGFLADAERSLQRLRLTTAALVAELPPGTTLAPECS